MFSIKTSLMLLPFFFINSNIFAMGKVQEARGLLNSFIYMRDVGMVAGILTKEGCSCLFVSGLANNFERGTKPGKYFKEAVKECQERASLPLLRLLKKGVKVGVYETDRKIEGLPYSEYKVVAENWDRNENVFNVEDPSKKGRGASFKVLKQRFEAVLDSNEKYGCRMRKTYDYEKAKVKSVRHLGTGLSIETKRNSNEYIPVKSWGVEEIVLRAGEMPAPADWPKTIKE